MNPKEDTYEDIIDLPHHVSKRHPPMPLADRGALFAPFAALTGHGDIIDDTARQHAGGVDAGLYEDAALFDPRENYVDPVEIS